MAAGVALCHHCGAEVAAGVNVACRECRLAPNADADWTLPPSDDEPDEIVFDLAEWPPADRVSLAVALDEEDVPWRWEPGPTLVVRTFDEAVVEELLDADDPDAGGDEGSWEDLEGEEADEEAQEAMGALFDLGDRLAHSPSNPELLLEVDRLATVIEQSAPPFGVEQGTWEDIGRKAEAVVAASDAEDEDAVMSAAKSLRDYLRDFV